MLQRLLMLLAILLALVGWGLAGEEDFQAARRHNQVRAWSMAQWEAER